jgi:hypothetical protein
MVLMAALLDGVDRLLVLRFDLRVEWLFLGRFAPVVVVRAFGLEVVDFGDSLWYRWRSRLRCC